jgi:hypothetical protein
MEFPNQAKPEVDLIRASWQRAAKMLLSTWTQLHTAVVEFGIGDSAAKELGTETVLADNVPLDEANAIGSYITGTGQLKERVNNFWDDRTTETYLDKTAGTHRVLLDLDCQHVYAPTSTPGHGHLIIDVPQTWENLNKLLQLLGDMHILQYGFVDATKSRGESWLRAPGVSKDQGGLGLSWH